MAWKYNSWKVLGQLVLSGLICAVLLAAQLGVLIGGLAVVTGLFVGRGPSLSEVLLASCIVCGVHFFFRVGTSPFTLMKLKRLDKPVWRTWALVRHKPSWAYVPYGAVKVDLLIAGQSRPRELVCLGLCWQIWRLREGDVVQLLFERIFVDRPFARLRARPLAGWIVFWRDDAPPEGLAEEDFTAFIT